MTGLITLILILAPMFIGFALPSSQKLVAKAEQGLNHAVLLILIVIGIELGLVENLSQKIDDIARYLVVLFTLTIGLGSLALMVFDAVFKSTTPIHTTHQTPHASLTGSFLQISCLAIGFALAHILPNTLHPPSQLITLLLMCLLFFVGISLKGSNISLKQVLLNKRGLQISMIFTLSTLLGGAIFALLFEEVSIYQGLALASGFGWYSLSGTIMTDAYGAVWGSVALINDLGREVLALLFIPWVMKRSASAAIGLGGVTSLDFTLPTLTQAGGTHIVPLIISFGFITNIISPILMVFFASLS